MICILIQYVCYIILCLFITAPKTSGAIAHVMVDIVHTTYLAYYMAICQICRNLLNNNKG